MAGRVLRQGATAIVALLGTAALNAAPAAARFDPIGVWTLKQDNAPRECRLQLREDRVGAGQAVAMPPGCHHAFPVLNGIRSWVLVDDAHLTLNNDADAAQLLFEDDGSGRLHAAGPEGGDSYTLIATGPRLHAGAANVRATPPGAQTVTTPTPAAAPVAVTTPEAVAGHYAVMRGSRDTGCMITLDEPAKASGTPLKARLAPACRDQGIIVFDPVGWQLKAGHLVLTARKGHTADLQRDETGHWVKDGKSAQPLGLKRL